MKGKVSRRVAFEQVAALSGMGLSELRLAWQERYGPVPKHRGPDLLRRVLAWRIQADAFGGLDAATVRLIGSERVPRMVAEQPGMRLARDYAGRRHEVLVVEGGVVYDGSHYGSLAAARLAIQQAKNTPKRTAPITMSGQQMRQKLIALAESFGLGSKLTMAARNGTSIPDQDLAGLLEDIADLGVDV